MGFYGFLLDSDARVSFVQGDITDVNYDLSDAFKDVDAVVSAIIGDAKVTVDGQKRLIDAAKKAGVKQFIPSAFSAEYRPVPQVRLKSRLISAEIPCSHHC